MPTRPRGVVPILGFDLFRRSTEPVAPADDSNDNAVFTFSTDVAFASPSAATSVVAARSASGPREWKLRGTGQLYRDWQVARCDPAGRTGALIKERMVG